ncbi:MAG: hypothetical protein M3338_06180, partial [Actinomycetota bacterium]|nr:hypothetical protein [Actinomycetota bacterium]
KTVRIDSVAETPEVFDVAGGAFGGKLMVTRRAGREVREALAERMEALSKGGVLHVDTRGVELMD